MRTLRQSLGLRQRRLARQTDLPESEISKIETGRHIPYPRQARRIARALGVRAEDLFGPRPADEATGGRP